MAEDVLSLLKKDHEKVKAMLEELSATTVRGVKRRQELVTKLQQEIVLHDTVEEELFYPALKASMQKADELKMYFEALEEHKAGLVVLVDVKKADPASPQFGGKIKVLKELITHHAEEEESELFKFARKHLSSAELKELGQKILERKEELMAQRSQKKSSRANGHAARSMR